MAGNKVFTDDVLEEIEAIKQIYEGQVTSALINEDKLTITLSDAKVLMNFNINGNYPDQVPAMNVLSYNGNINKLVKELEELEIENIGSPMLYTLISKVLDIALTVESENNEQSQKNIQCKFYMEGKCLFGTKCFNLHGDSPTKNTESPNNVNNSNNETDNSIIASLDHSSLPNQTTQPKQTKVNKIKRKKHEDDLPTDVKKSSMKTATDVINRILWDDSFPTENFLVGYLDRFLGIQEKPFTAFSWEDIASVDYNVLAIPKHRIQYFKFKSVIIWDKNERLDLVFGSTGNEVAIMEVIDSESETKLKDSVIVKEESEDDVRLSHFDSQNRPNYFMALRISDEEVKQNIIEIQDGIIYYDERLKSVLLKPNHFHITLCMMRLNNEGDFIKAGTVLKSLEKILVCMHPLNKSFLTLKGIKDFREQVIIAHIIQNPLFNKFVEITKLKLKDAGIKLVGNHEPYSAHVTLLKLNRPFSKENNMETINKMYFSEFADSYVGTQSVNEIRICSTGVERGPDDFYLTLSSITNSLLCVSSKLPALISIHVQNLMGAGLILEDMGDDMLTEILSNDPIRFETIMLSLEDLLTSFSDFYCQNRKHVIIMRGLPGSGKSYLVQKLQQQKRNAEYTIGVCSADQYFQEKEFGYKFNDQEISSAHFACQDSFIESIAQRCDIIIVDNTHLQKWEYQIYKRIALLCGYLCHVVSIDPGKESVQRKFLNRCSHNVNSHVFSEMNNKFENDNDALLIEDSDVSFSFPDLLNYGSLIPLTSCAILYTSLYLDESSRDLIRSVYPPIHENVTCDHVTLIFEPTKSDLLMTSVGDIISINVTGYIVNDCIQAVLVSDTGVFTDDSTNEKRKLHITISTSKDTPPKDVGYWAHYLPCLPSKEAMTLTGTVGVQIATSKTKSIQCVESNRFSSFLGELCRGVNLEKKPETLDKDQMEILSSDDNSDNGEDVNLYFGPDVVKSLYVFDFDGTLFHTPGPADGREHYQKTTGLRWPHKGWLGHSTSLKHPLHIYPGPSLRDYFEHCERACTKSVLITGRIEKVRNGVQPVLDMHGLSFEEVILKPMHGSATERKTVHGYKKETVKSLMKALPHLKTVIFWDDRIDNITQLKNLDKTLKNVEIETFHVDATTPNIDGMTISILLERMGIRPSDVFNAGVKKGLEYISMICKDVFGITDDQEFLYPFGSYLLMRRGDVDVCVLAPKNLNVDQYITRICEKAKSYGLEYAYVASGIRCPVVKLQLRYLELPPIDFDIVLACVLEENIDGYHDIERLHSDCTDQKSKAALDGVVFFYKIVAPVLDRLDVKDFGMVVDVTNLILKRNNLKGNVFHCIRTFHIVKLLAKFIPSCPNELLPLEGWQNLKEFNKFLENFLLYLSKKTFDDYKKLFKGFVPDIYIESMRMCFLQSSGLDIKDILFTAPPSSPSDNNVKILLTCKDSILLWHSICLFEARLGSCIRKLIQNGVEITPGVHFNNTFSFNAQPLDVCRETLMAFNRDICDELPSDVIVKFTLK